MVDQQNVLGFNSIPAGATVRRSYQSPTRHDQGLNLRRTCLQTSSNEVAQ